MRVIDVTPAGLPRAIEAFDRDVRRAFRRAVLDAALMGLRIITEQGNIPVDTGRLRQSATVVKRGPLGYPEIVVRAPYAGHVEHGTRPHWVPLGALVRWVRRNRGLFGLTGSGRRRKAASGQFASYGPEIVRIARAIRLKIARVGTKPRWFVRKNLPRLREALDDAMRRARVEVLAGAGGGA